jgi:hypothetical protein
MSTAAWQNRYAELATRLPEMARRARPVLCGLGACVDVYVRLEEAVRALDGGPATPSGALRERLLERARRGIGGEIRVDWPGGPAWLDARLPRRFGLGGTGAQAAQTLAILGAPTLLALADRSAALLALIHSGVRVAGPDGFVPVGMIEAAGRGRPPHYIVEFTAGVPAGHVVPPRSSRVIVRFDDDPLEADPRFIRASADVAHAAGAAILSGFNALPYGAFPRVLAWVRPLAGSWRVAGLRRVHLELGDFVEPAGADEVLRGLAGSASALGLSHSELLKLALEGDSLVERAQTLADRHGFDRIAVHADRFALALTRDDPEQELEALMAGALVAATRASRGRIAVPQACPPGAVFTEPRQPAIGRRGAWSVVCCPTPYLPRPAATIGLGDSFLAGTLLVLSEATGQPATISSRIKETTA